MGEEIQVHGEEAGAAMTETPPPAEQPQGEEKVRLKKEINLTFATAMMTGCIIGSGIFVSPTSIVQHTGSVGMALVMWAVSGALTVPLVLCYAELGCLYPGSGGEYLFFKEVLGDLPAFLQNWVFNMVIQPACYAIFTLTTANYLFYPFYPDCPPPDAAIKLISVVILVFIIALNSVYVKYVGRAQTFFTAVKIIALIIIIVTCFVELGRGKTDIIASGFENTNTDIGGYAVAIYSGMFTYSGWEYLFMLLEEVKRPEKIVPQATLISMFSVIILYLLTNIAYFTVMTPQEMMASPVVAVTFAERTLGPFALIVPILVACSTIGVLNGASLGGSRVAFAAARDGLFPDIVSTINVKYCTPWASLWMICGLSIIYILTGEAVALVEYIGFVTGLIYITAVWCVLLLRWRRPDAHRAVKLPLAVVICIFVITILLAVLGLYEQPVANGIGVLLILSGIPAYIVGVKWQSKPRSFRRAIYNFNVLMQKAFLISAEDKED